MHDVRLKRINFRAWRRGFREADLILGPFADRYCPNLSNAELDQFEALLDQEDHDVYDWITGRQAPPSLFDTPLLAQLQAFQKALPIAGGDLSGV